MTGEPPFSVPSFHDRPTWVASVIPGTFSKSVGASGTVRIIAPFPYDETRELPFMLVAMICALILAPQA